MKSYLQELIKRRDLLVYLVLSGLKAEYRNTFLGYLWWILDPLMMGLVYYFLRVVVLGMEGENIGLFLIIGLIAWHWIRSTLKSATKSISDKSKVITNVYLPKAIFPISATLTQLVNFAFGLVAVAIFLVAYRVVPGIEVLWIPFIMLVQFLFLSALALFFAYVCIFIKDIDNIITHITRLWFWTSPVIWEAGRLPPRYSIILDINPATAFIMSYRNVLMYSAQPEFEKLIFIGLASLVVLVYMIYYYYQNEHKMVQAL